MKVNVKLRGSLQFFVRDDVYLFLAGFKFHVVLLENLLPGETLCKFF